MYQHILTAIDGSARTARVMDTVEYLAKSTGAAVHVLHAKEAEAVYDRIVDLEDDGEARAVIDREVARLRAAGVNAEGEVDDVLHENVADLVVTRARELGSDLIVLGPRHHSRIGELLGSSVSHEVSRHAPASLLLVV